MIRSRDPAYAILLFSLAALASVLIAQYGFGLRPCPLCLYQRVPYCVAAVLTALALVARLSARQIGILLGLCLLAFLANTGLALFHVGVEQHWWTGPASCSGGLGTVQSVDDLKAMLSAPIDIPSCDKVAWSLFGISMAGYNLLASVGLAGFSAMAALRSLGLSK